MNKIGNKNQLEGANSRRFSTVDCDDGRLICTSSVIGAVDMDMTNV